MTKIPQQSFDFISASAPFDQLDIAQRSELVKSVTVAYLSQENHQPILAEKSDCLFLISSGQFSVKDSAGPQKHLSEGDFFNVENLLKGLKHEIQLTVDSPGLVYCLPASEILDLIDTYPKVATFFEHYHAEALHEDVVGDSRSMWLYRSISEVLSGNVISCERDTSILDAVKRMSEHHVSSLLITHQETLVGIITDRDIRNRIVANQVDLQLPVVEVMTENPARIAHHRTLFDALCSMTERNIHHLPVIEAKTGKPVGMLSASDMIRHQRGNVLFLIDELAKAQSLYDLTRLSWQLPHYFAKHAKRLGDFDVAGKVLSQATDIMTRKLITFFLQQNGEAPFDFCWLVYGSGARADQTMGSDQDNALLLERKPDAQQGEYFARLADYVCQGLGKCGIKLCDGNIMASNPELRMSLEDAVAEARGWVSQPTNDAILHFNIFLDVRAVAGNTDLFNRLQEQRTPLLKQPIFLAALARHANQANVPLSMFQKFVFKKGHSREDCIDLKVNAIAIINNLVRIYALDVGLKVPSTLARLDALAEQGQLSQSDVKNLRDIWLFLNRLRWRHQLQNSVTDNYVCINDLSSIEKHQLKAAFKSIKRAQQGVLIKFAQGMG